MFTKYFTLLGSTQSVCIIKNTKCRNPSITALYKELWDRLRVAFGLNQGVPNNQSRLGPNRRLGGDGVIVVRGYHGRVTVFSQKIRTLTSKAGQQTKRGSDSSIESTHPKDINIKAIANMKNLIVAYELIKSKPGNMTKGTTPETLDGITKKYLEKIQKDLRSGKYEFTPARRVNIPKSDKKEKRPLTIGSPRDKIVQKAIQLVMAPVFEKMFLDCSHGFRPKKGTRTAMQYLDSKFQSSHYIIEADFTKAFDSIIHKKLMECLRETITCEKTLRLINSGLKAGYIELGQLHDNLSYGTPQGSILSPLLCNIFLHKLDMFMESIKAEHNVGTKHSKTKEYTSLSNKRKYMKKKGLNKTNPELYHQISKKLLLTPSTARDERYVRINYVRYADDFLIGVEGSYKTAALILEKVQKFIKNQLGLELNPDKTGIVAYSIKPVKFLGYKLMAPHKKGIEKPIESIKRKSSSSDEYSNVTRRKKIRIRIHMDYMKALKKLELNRFIRKRVSHKDHSRRIYRGTFKGNLINLNHADILLYYNSVMRGLYNYYNFTSNAPNLANII